MKPKSPMSNQPAMQRDDPEKEWWDEDAERHNKLSEMARANGKTIKTGSGIPPKLKDDGSLEDGEDGI